MVFEGLDGHGPVEFAWYDTRPGSSMLLLMAGADVVLNTLTGVAYCASIRRAEQWR
jgi:hypothetical protein